MQRLTSILIIGASALLLTFGLGCGGDDGEEQTVDDTGGGNGGKDVSSPGDGADGVVDFKGYVVAFGTNPEQTTAGVVCELLDDETGAASGITQTTDEEGWLEFKGLPADSLVGFKCTKDKHKDTYQFHISPEMRDEKLWIVSLAVYNPAVALAGLEVQDGTGTLAGAVYFVNSDGEEEPVGGATVTSEPPTDDVRYMHGETGLPTTPDQQACTHSVHGRFLTANLTAGSSATVTATDANGDVVGSVVIPVVADSIAVGNIYVDTAENTGKNSCAE
jgi:hypothetical protein